MAAAFNLYSTNLRTILHRTWLPALLLSLMSALALLLAAQTGSMVAILASSAVSIVAYACSVWYFCIIASLLNGESFRHNLPRIILLALLLLGIMIAAGVVTGGLSMIPLLQSAPTAITQQQLSLSGIITMAALIVFAIVLLPLFYSCMRYVMLPKEKVMGVAGRSYLRGWRHFGYLFMAVLLSGIILAIILFVAYMPMTIVSLSASIDNAGLLMGDASGLPSYFPVLAFFTYAVATFISTYVMTWLIMVEYYVFGHIEAKEKARRQVAVKTERR